MKFVASRLSEGNRLFPAEIHTEETGIKVRIPGFLSGDTRFINYENITAVDIDTPMVGFSSITFYYQGNQAFAHGFKKSEAKKIKEAIDNGREKSKVTTINHNLRYINTPVQQPLAEKIINQPTNTSNQSSNIPDQSTNIPTQPTNTSNQHFQKPLTQEQESPIGFYNEQIEKLIKLALADGELTEKEKQILFKRAEAEGIDLDEFEMVLDARLFEKTQNKSNEPVAPKSDKFGDIKKCPSCGSIIESFSTRCPDCGHDFSNINNVNSIREFFENYQLIESKVIVKKENNGLVDRLDRFLGGTSQNLDWERAVFIKKKEFITLFPIPNSREDILEFLSMAIPLASPAKKNTFSALKKFASNYGDDFQIAEVWLHKCEQIIMKARFSMKDDKKTLAEIENYAKEIGIK